jgi:hypothetical protein
MSHTQKKSSKAKQVSQQITLGSCIEGKVTGKITGTYQIVELGDLQNLTAGTITGGKMNGNSFRLSGVESETVFCQDPIPSITITGQCGDNVLIAFKGDMEEPDKVKTEAAMFSHASIACSK